MARKQESVPRIGEVRDDYERSLENYMLKAGQLAAQVDAILSLEQVKTPAVAERLQKALNEFMAA